MKWPLRPPSVAGLIRHLMDQHGLTHLDETVFRGRKIKMRVRGADGKAQTVRLRGQSSAERAGIELIDENSCGPGIRLRKPRNGKTSQVGQPELRRRLCL